MDFLNSIETLDENGDSLFSLEDACNIHPSLNMENPLTFMLFISKRPDLCEADVLIYNQIIAKLEHNEKVRFQSAMKKMVDVTEIHK